MKAFYGRPEAERIALTEEAIGTGASLIARWSALGDEEASPWNARAAAAGEWLNGEAGVIDIGCGTMMLEAHLPDTQYWPCDICYRDARTIVCDLNKNAIPFVPATAAACLGLLEYLHAPRAFMQALGRAYPTVVISYCTVDAPAPVSPRKAHGWVNDLSRSQLETLFVESGWNVVNFRQVDDIQGLWKLIRS